MTEPLRHQALKIHAEKLAKRACEGPILVESADEYLRRTAGWRRMGNLRAAWRALENARASRIFYAAHDPHRAQRYNDIDRDGVLAAIKAKRESKQSKERT